MSDRVYKALVARELRRRETVRVAEAVLGFLVAWAETGERFVLDLSGVAADTEIPAGSLAHVLGDPATCNALAKASSDPPTLLSLLLAYEASG